MAICQGRHVIPIQRLWLPQYHIHPFTNMPQPGLPPPLGHLARHGFWLPPCSSPVPLPCLHPHTELCIHCLGLPQSGLNNRNASSHSSRVHAQGVGRVGSFRSCEGGSVRGSPAASGHLLAIWVSLAYRTSPQSLPSASLGILPVSLLIISLYAYVSVSQFLPFTRTESHWIRAHPSDFILP